MPQDQEPDEFGAPNMPQIFDLTEQYRNQLMSREDNARTSMLKDYRGIWRGLEDKIETAAKRIEFSDSEKMDLAGAFKDEPASAGGESTTDLPEDKLSKFTGLLLQKNPWQELERELDRQFTSVADSAAGVTEDHRRALGQTAVDHAVKLMQAQIGKERVAGLSKEALAELNKRTKDEVERAWQEQREDLREAFRAKAAEAALQAREALRQEVLHGILINATAKQILGRVKSAIDDREANPETDPTLVRALRAEYRIATQNSYRESMRFVFAESGRVTQWRWTSARTARTCAVCWAMDGKVFPIETPLKSHPHCRCVPVPIVEDEEGNALRRTEREGGETGDVAFADIPPLQQKAILGMKAFAAYERGEFDLSDLIGVQFNTRFGMTLYRQSVDRAVEQNQNLKNDPLPAPVTENASESTTGNAAGSGAVGIVSTKRTTTLVPFTRPKIRRGYGKSFVSLTDLGDETLNGDPPTGGEDSSVRIIDDPPPSFVAQLEGPIIVTPEEISSDEMGRITASDREILKIWLTKLTAAAGLRGVRAEQAIDEILGTGGTIIDFKTKKTEGFNILFEKKTKLGFEFYASKEQIETLWLALDEQTQAGGNEIYFSDEKYAADPMLVLRRFLQMNHFGASLFFAEFQQEIVQDAYLMGIRPVARETRRENGTIYYALEITDEQKTMLARLMAKWKPRWTQQDKNNEAARLETSETFVDFARLGWNNMVGNAEFLANIPAFIYNTRGGYHPGGAFDPNAKWFDFSGIRAGYKSNYFNTDVNGKINPKGWTRAKAFELFPSLFTGVGGLVKTGLNIRKAFKGVPSLSILPENYNFKPGTLVPDVPDVPKGKIPDADTPDIPKGKVPETEVPPVKPGSVSDADTVPPVNAAKKTNSKSTNTGRTNGDKKPVTSGKPTSNNVKKPVNPPVKPGSKPQKPVRKSSNVEKKPTNKKPVETKTDAPKKPVNTNATTPTAPTTPKTPTPSTANAEKLAETVKDSSKIGRESVETGRAYEDLVEEYLKTQSRAPFYKPKTGQAGFDFVSLEGDKVVIYEAKFVKEVKKSEFTAIRDNFKINAKKVLDSLDSTDALTETQKLRVRSVLENYLKGRSSKRSLEIRVVTGNKHPGTRMKRELKDEFKRLNIEFETVEL